MPSGRFGHSDLTKLLTPSIRGLEQTVGVKSEDRSLFGANRGTYKLSGWKNAQRQVWAFQLDHVVGLWRKVQNRRVTCKASPQPVSVFGQKTSGDKHFWSL